MNCFDYDAMALDGEVYCVGCLPDGVTEEEADPIFADSEWQSYPVCGACGTVHEYVTLLEN